MEYIPFVYYLKHIPTDLKYIGVKYAKGCHPKDFWVTYFTSSKLIGKLIEEYGKESFMFKIIHTFPNNPEAAIIKEASYFPLMQKRDDFLNCCYSSGIQDLRIASKAGRVGGAIVKERRIGICTEDTQKRSEWASLGGKIGGKNQYIRGEGIHDPTISPTTRREWCSLGGKNSGLFQDPKFQSEMGSRGGKKNLGSVWVNDGIRSFKFTNKMSKQESLDEYLKRTNYKVGRI